MSLQAPTSTVNKTISGSPKQAGNYVVGKWISPSGFIIRNITIERSYNFLFSMYGNASGTTANNATFFVELGIYRNGQEWNSVFSTESDFLPNDTILGMLWQTRINTKLPFLVGDRVFLTLWLHAYGAGTWFFAYDSISCPSSFNDPVETRYFRSTQGTLDWFVLGTIQSVSAKQSIVPDGQPLGIRVWKRASDGTETEITAGTPVAQVTIPYATQMLSATWTSTETSLVSTDSIVVRIYWYLSGVWYLAVTDDIPEKNCEYHTEQLGASQLDSTLWTVYYQFRLYQEVEYFRFGVASANSRIENFSYTAGQTALTLFGSVAIDFSASAGSNYTFSNGASGALDFSPQAGSTYTTEWGTVGTVDFNTGQGSLWLWNPQGRANVDFNVWSIVYGFAPSKIVANWHWWLITLPLASIIGIFIIAKRKS